MNQIRELCEKLEKIGHKFLGISLSDDGLFMIYALDPEEAKRLYGPKPKREDCRDYLDYKISLKNWKMKGTYVLYADKNPEIALANALFQVPK